VRTAGVGFEFSALRIWRMNRSGYRRRLERERAHKR
jgi:hypothetical protein